MRRIFGGKRGAGEMWTRKGVGGLLRFDSRGRQRVFLTVAAGLIAVAFAAISWADVVVPDGDVVSVGDQSTVNLGNVSPGATLTPKTSFKLVCDSKNHVDLGQTLTLSYSSSSSTIPGGSMTATNASIGPIPASWPDDSSGSGTTNCPSPSPTPLGDNGDSTVTITAPTAPGTYTFIPRWTFSLSPTGSGDSSAVQGSGTTVSYTLTVVANAAPTVSAISGDGTADEGDTKTYSVTATDPDSDALTYAWSVTSGNATIPGSTTGSSAGVNFTDGPSTVGLQAVVDDGHGHTVTRTRSVTENNVAPTVNLSGDSTASEGQTKTYTYSVSDPGNDPSPTITESCGANGTRTDTPAVNSFDCTFPDGPASSTVMVSANDGDDTGSASINVTVQNLDPTVELSAGNASSFGESATLERTFNYSASDPAGAADPLTATISCGTGGSYVGGSDTGSSFKCKFPDGPASPTVSISVNDGDGGTDSDSQNVTVQNLDPTATITGAPTTSPEGTAVNLGSTVSDPSAVDVAAGFTRSWSVTKNGNPYGSGSATSFTFTPDDNGTYIVSFSANDKDGGTGSDTKTITVTNVAPTISSFAIVKPAGAACSGATNKVTVSFAVGDPADQAVDPITGSITWGDGSLAEPISGRSISQDHNYAPGGPYTIDVSVNDGDGGTASAGGSASAFTVTYATSGILQPINITGTRSAFKLGSTIPVKVKITDCNGNPVSGLSPQISLTKLDATPEGSAIEDFYSTVPDQGTTMRFTGSPDYQYIYNLGTKNQSQGDYKVTITDATIAAVSATFSIKK
jgi:hypothetical protein